MYVGACGSAGRGQERSGHDDRGRDEDGGNDHITRHFPFLILSSNVSHLVVQHLCFQGRSGEECPVQEGRWCASFF